MTARHSLALRFRFVVAAEIIVENLNFEEALIVVVANDIIDFLLTAPLHSFGDVCCYLFMGTQKSK